MPSPAPGVHDIESDDKNKIKKTVQETLPFKEFVGRRASLPEPGGNEMDTAGCSMGLDPDHRSTEGEYKERHNLMSFTRRRAATGSAGLGQGTGDAAAAPGSGRSEEPPGGESRLRSGLADDVARGSVRVPRGVEHSDAASGDFVCQPRTETRLSAGGLLTTARSRRCRGIACTLP